MQQEKDYTFTEARHETPTDDMKANTQYNNGPETNNDCTPNPKATNVM